MATDCLLADHRFEEVLDLISRYNHLIQLGKEHNILKHLRLDQRGESVIYQAAEFYKHRDHRLMTVALQKLPNVEDRITFLQRNGFVDEAAALLMEEGKTEEAAKLMRSNAKFLEAARFSKDDGFIADCYLLTARSTIQEKIQNKETEEFITGILGTAAKMYKKCNNRICQAEVLFARGKFFTNCADINEAGNLYYQTLNYVALTDCLLLLIETEKDPSKTRRKAISTLSGLLRLLLALHKDTKETSERTTISMCHAYFGLENTNDMYTKKIALKKMVRFINIENARAKLTEDGLIPATDADTLIKNHLFQVTHNLIKQLWNKHQQILDGCKLCLHLLSGTSCNLSKCIHHHAKMSRVLFRDRFYALLFLVRLDEMIATFLKSIKRGSVKIKNQLQQLLFIEPEFTVCQWLYDFLFSRDGQPVLSYFLTVEDLNFLRLNVSCRVKKFATKFLWYRSSKEERLSSSDLFIEVSNMMCVAGATAENLLCVEERRLKGRKRSSHPAMLSRGPGSFEIFSKSLERSKYKLHQDGDVLESIEAAVR